MSIMTLILTTITPDYIIQVSDRRVTYLTHDPSGGDNHTLEPRDDDSTKSVVIQHEGLAAYTGLALLPRTEAFAQLQSLEREDIDSGLWLAEAISLQMKTGIALLDSVNDTFSTMPYSELGHAIIMAYWHRASDKSIVPIVSVIHNSNQESVFVQENHMIGDGNESLTVFSKPVNDGVGNNYILQVNKILKNKASLEDVVDLMVDTVIEISHIDETVGSTVNVVCSPKKHFEEAVRLGRWELTDETINPERFGFGLIESELDGRYGRRTSPYFLIGDLIMGSLTIGVGGKIVVQITEDANKI